jgi:alkanesulfonate monooxygenase SsuD/methylene tetrahydromethanopterin reductase-like flavin-dependent oxidoreductase (luciferase family)
MHGYEYPDTKTRLERFADGLEVLTSLLRSDTPISHAGPRYRLDGARLVREGSSRGPRILVGGNSAKSILALSARYADVWNAFWLTPDDFRDRCRRLDELLLAEGRDPSSVQRSIALLVILGHDHAGLEDQAAAFRTWRPESGALPLEEFLDRLRADHRAVVGDADQLAEAIAAYGAAGADEVVLHRADIWAEPVLERIAAEVLPVVAATPGRALPRSHAVDDAGPPHPLSGAPAPP